MYETALKLLPQKLAMQKRAQGLHSKGLLYSMQLHDGKVLRPCDASHSQRLQLIGMHAVVTMELEQRGLIAIAGNDPFAVLLNEWNLAAEFDSD